MGESEIEFARTIPVYEPQWHEMVLRTVLAKCRSDSFSQSKNEKAYCVMLTTEAFKLRHEVCDSLIGLKWDCKAAFRKSSLPT